MIMFRYLLLTASILISVNALGETCRVAVTGHRGGSAGVVCSDDNGKQTRNGIIYWWQAKDLAHDSFTGAGISPDAWFALNSPEFSKMLVTGKIKIYPASDFNEGKRDHERGKCLITDFSQETFVYEITCYDQDHNISKKVFATISDFEKLSGEQFRGPNGPMDPPLLLNDYLDRTLNYIKTGALPTYKTLEEAASHQGAYSYKTGP
jgi:hypothetical protein